MNFPSALLSFLNLGGQELILILAVLLIFGMAAAVVLVIVLFINHRSSRRPPGIPSQAAQAALAEIDSLKAGGAITEAEYLQKRAEILTRI